MRNFKRYLTESQTCYITVDIKLNFNSKTCKFSKEELENFNTELLKNYFSELYNYNTTIQFEREGSDFKLVFLKINVSKQYTESQENFLEFFTNLSSKCKEFLGTKETKIPFSHLIFLNIIGDINNIPYPISVDKISLQPSDNCTLTKINNILNCKSLVIVNPSKITGNVLSLLKINDLRKIVFLQNDSSKISVGWGAIINKYLMNSNKDDILGCQDELIDNGFSKYAKL
jgi:hypothetical protein